MLNLLPIRWPPIESSVPVCAEPSLPAISTFITPRLWTLTTTPPPAMIAPGVASVLPSTVIAEVRPLR